VLLQSNLSRIFVTGNSMTDHKGGEEREGGKRGRKEREGGRRGSSQVTRSHSTLTWVCEEERKAETTFDYEGEESQW
jgi:hypothetical protein